MRGGLERWKRGAESHGVRQAISYALKGTCDSHLRATTGTDALATYSEIGTAGVDRFVVQDGAITQNRLDEAQLRRWVDGCDPETGERRGRDLSSPTADLLLDGTINAPKSYSIAALLHPELAVEFEALQNRLRDRIIRTWQGGLNARRGAGGRTREALHRVEVVELKHRRSRALDPHIHRHLWLNVKVQGEDGQWSNVDSRVAMKLHTLINAEGELAARTDPEWVAALARHGYTLNPDGEVAELAHAVRPLSRRSTQIEANRAVQLTAWRDAHPGEQPSADVVKQIDRWAWAKGRPNKPDVIDETEWEDLIREELAAIDPALLDARTPVPVPAAVEIDRELLAAQALVEADARSAACGGRFSLIDLRAGVLRALAGFGLVAPRKNLSPLIEDLTARAVERTIDLLDGEVDRPDHIKGFMSIATAALKVDLAARLDALTVPGTPADEEEITAAGERCLDPGVQLDADQVLAAAAIAGTDRLVSVTGPAGAGKTTMLRVAKEALDVQGRRMVVVAPTKKAASVAGREVGTTASSLHALLADHGWRWTTDPAGAETWTRLPAGAPDPTRDGQIYTGPQRYLLDGGDRVVVDEAGMVDLRTANALAQVAADTGAGIVMVGDHRQALPVGHGGAMATLTRRATAVVELTSVHRFRDPEYAALTLRMREPADREDAHAIASILQQRGHLRAVVDTTAARDLMVDGYFTNAERGERVALVSSTNEEAHAINEAIQQRRVDLGQLQTVRLAVGQGEQRLLEGDVVQTRRNDTRAGVENRALWQIHHIHDDTLELRSVADSTQRRTVTRDYAAEHVHLAYASTVHGIQGDTTDAAIVGPGVDASGLYVGMTRGRTHNEVIVIAPAADLAIESLADTMVRGVPETTIDDAIRGARTDLNRAARLSAPVPRWDDARQRPYGATINPAAQLASHARHRADLLAAATDLQVWITQTEHALADLDARSASQDANHHGRTDPGRQSSGKRQMVVDRLDVRREELAELAGQAAAAGAAITLLSREEQLRSTLSPTDNAGESRARVAREAASVSGAVDRSVRIR